MTAQLHYSWLGEATQTQKVFRVLHNHAHTYISKALKGTQWTHNSTYQVPDIAWLKMGGGDGRRTQRSEGDAHKEERK